MESRSGRAEHEWQETVLMFALRGKGSKLELVIHEWDARWHDFIH
jgi:hypothetical protein